MKKFITSFTLIIIFLGINQIVFGDEQTTHNRINVNTSIEIQPRKVVKFHFKTIPSLKYKGLVRIDYYYYSGWYIGAYL